MSTKSDLYSELLDNDMRAAFEEALKIVSLEEHQSPQVREVRRRNLLRWLQPGSLEQDVNAQKKARSSSQPVDSLHG